MDFKTEIIAGVTTFLVMAYILGVNPTMLLMVECLQQGCFFPTAISAGIASIIMGFLSKYPAFLALIGIFITLILYVQKIPAAVFFGVIVTAIQLE